LEFKNDYFEIRLESIGGLGANLSGKILGELGALYLNLNSSCFSSYGSEKRGSPVKSYIRYSNLNKPIRVNSPVESPDILGLFHEKLSDKDMAMAGVDEHTSVVVNTRNNADCVRDKLKMYCGKLYCIDALKIAMENKTRINMVMLGAIIKSSEFIPVEKLIEAVSNTIGKKYPHSLKNNIDGINAGYNAAEGVVIQNDGKYPYVKYQEIEREWGYKNAPIGGINTVFGSTITNNLSTSREGYVPVFHKERCINCGLCDSTCPDMVFQFDNTENKGLDYDHCKGCLRCVEVCPTEALTAAVERDYDVDKFNIGNIYTVKDYVAFEDVGANSWVNEESYVENKLN